MRGRTVAAILGLLLSAAAAGAADRLRVIAAGAPLYSRPASDSFKLLSLEKGAELELVARVGDWYLVKVVSSTVKGAVGVKGHVSRSDAETVPGLEEPKAAAVPPPPVLRAAPAPKRAAPPAPVEDPAPAPTARPAGPARPPEPPPPVVATVTTPQSRFVLLINAGAVPTSLDFSETRTFTEFAEEGGLDVDNAYDTGFGGEVGLRYFFTERIGAEAVFSYTTRSGSAEFTGRFPHPLYLARPRLVTGTVDGLSHKESAAHVNVVYGGAQGKLGYAFFGGASFFFQVEPGLIGPPQYSHAFPFDSITITTVPVLSESQSAIGFNVGGEFEYRFSPRVGAALSARYSRASVEFDLDEANQVKLDAGGLFVGLGIRVRF